MDTVKNAALESFPFFERTPDMVCIANKEGFFERVNAAVIEKLEYTEEELFTSPIYTFIHPDDRYLTSQERTRLLDGKPLINFQNRYVTKTGKTIWLDWTSIYFPDKEVVFAIAKDITVRKQIEKEIEEDYKKMKTLASHFKSRIEKDRKYFAAALHEEIAQLASVVKMDIDWLNIHMPDLSGLAKKRIDHVLAVSDLMIDKIRKISFSISPYMLDNIGLDATLQWLCKEFTIQHNIPCRYESNYNETSINREMQLDFFRICQEALTNILLHAQASSVRISIDEIDHTINLLIIDDGKGFIVDGSKQTSGLTGIRELAASINAQLTIESNIGKGTTVRVTVTI